MSAASSVSVSDGLYSNLEEDQGLRSAVLTDIEMPGSMDGIRLAHVVRDRWPPVHLVVASGHELPPTSQLPDGARFLSKPFRPREIAKALRA
nr:response regulator [Bosea sp. REN20]